MEPNVEIIVGIGSSGSKVVDFLHRNWALIEQPKGDDGCTVYFMGDTSLVFDRLSFSSRKTPRRLYGEMDSQDSPMMRQPKSF
jgi:hypothetical protein